MIKSLLVKLAARLKEPSTHAALMGIVGAAGLTLDAGLVQNGLLVVAGLFGVLGVLLPEKK